MDNIEIGKRLKSRRIELGMTQGDIASEIGVAISTIQRYETGSIEKVKLPVLQAIARVLHVNPNWLIAKSDEKEVASSLPDNAASMPSTYKVPRLGQIACGDPILAEENIEDYDNVPAYIKCDFTLVCRGDSMINARIYDGDIVCVKADAEVHSGDIAAVLVDGNEATLKRIELFDDHIVLRPENPTYRPLSFWENDMNRVRIIGKATHFISVVR